MKFLIIGWVASIYIFSFWYIYACVFFIWNLDEIIYILCMTYTTLANVSDYLQMKSDHISDIYSQKVDGTWPGFLEHLFAKINYHIGKNGRTLVLALTKKSCEEIANFFISKGYKTYYLHSEISTFDRWEIIKKLRSGEIDILVGVNLLREWIDMPEVSFIAILDADKEWFLRSMTSLVQIIWRAARNPHSEVILYADNMTESMSKALFETYRRRNTQIIHNTKYGIEPTKAISNIKDIDSVKTDNNLQSFDSLTRGKNKKLKRMTKKEKEIIMKDLKWQMDTAIANREFEKAAIFRDQIKELDEM